MNIKEIAEFLEVNENRALEALKSVNLKPETVDAAQLAALHMSMQGAITAPTKPAIAKPVQPTTAIAINKPAETAPVASQTAAVSDDEEAKLLAEIENLKKAKRIAALRQQAIQAKEDLLATETELAEREAAHELRSQAVDKLTSLAIQNGKAMGENAIARQEQALGELLEVSKETPLDCEIGVLSMKQRQAEQRNKLQRVLNQTPQLLPAMSQDSSNGMRTVETVAV